MIFSFCVPLSYTILTVQENFFEEFSHWQTMKKRWRKDDTEWKYHTDDNCSVCRNWNPKWIIANVSWFSIKLTLSWLFPRKSITFLNTLPPCPLVKLITRFTNFTTGGLPLRRFKAQHWFFNPYSPCTHMNTFRLPLPPTTMH